MLFGGRCSCARARFGRVSRTHLLSPHTHTRAGRRGPRGRHTRHGQRGAQPGRTPAQTGDRRDTLVIGGPREGARAGRSAGTASGTHMMARRVAQRSASRRACRPVWAVGRASRVFASRAAPPGGGGGRGGGPGAGGGGGAQGRAPHISVRADGPARGLISQTHPTTNENSSSKVCSTISDFTRLRPAVRPPTPGSAAGSPLHCARRSAQLPRPAGGGSTGGARRRRRRGRARGRGRRAVRRAA